MTTPAAVRAAIELAPETVTIGDGPPFWLPPEVCALLYQQQCAAFSRQVWPDLESTVLQHMGAAIAGDMDDMMLSSTLPSAFPVEADIEPNGDRFTIQVKGEIVVRHGVLYQHPFEDE